MGTWASEVSLAPVGPGSQVPPQVGEPEARRGVVWNPSCPHPTQLLAVLGQVCIGHFLYRRPGSGVSDWPVCSRSGGLSVHTGLSLALLDELVTPVAPSTEGRQRGQTGHKKLTAGVRQQSAGGKLPQPGRRAVSREMSELRLVNAEPLGQDSSWGAGGAESGRVGKSCRAWWAQGRTQAFPPGMWEPWRAVGRERAQCMLGRRAGGRFLGKAGTLCGLQSLSGALG